MTDSRPKPLIPIYNKPLITFALDHLIAAGVKRFVMNTHHLAEQFEAAFASGEYRGCPVQLVYEPDLLETGGGIKNAEPWIGHDPFFVYSGDILTDIDLPALIEEHFRAGNEVTMALRDTGLAAGVTLDGGRVTDFRGRYGAAGTNHDFANVSIWNAGVFARIPERKKIGFIPVLSDWLDEGVRIGGVLCNHREWFNVGSRQEYLSVHRVIAANRWRPAYVDEAEWPGDTEGANAVGTDCRIEDDVTLENTVIWDHATVARGSRLRGCIVRDHRAAAGTHEGQDF